jgi:molybdate transport system substrate-binding protein
MKKMVLWMGLALLVGCGQKESATKPLLVHVGGTMGPVFKELAQLYTEQTGQKVQINMAGSGELLANIELQAEGDLYVSHDPFLDIIMRKGLAKDGWTLAELYPVIVVQKGNPKKIYALKDLARDDVQLALTDYKLSTLGRILPTIFAKAGMDLKALTKQKNIIIHRSGSHVANLVVMKSADAALVWNAVGVLREESLDRIEITKYLPVRHVDGVTSATGKYYILTPVRVTICSLKCSTNLKGSKEFIRFVTSEKARAMLEKYGFGVSADLRRQEYRNGKER